MECPSLDHFRPFLSIHDPRLDRKKLHKLIDILVITLCAVLCNVDDWEHIAEFGEANEEWFKRFLTLENGIPSHDTFGRVFSLINPVEFEKSFLEWMKLLYQVTEGEIVAIDGKSIKGTYDKKLGKVAVHLVSAFATRHGVTLGQVKTEEKSNEITAIPKLLELLNLKNCLVTTDALGCQKEITKKIIAGKSNYILGLKGNQGGFYDDIKLYVDSEFDKEKSNGSMNIYETIEKDHGRIESRRYWVTDQIEWLENKSEWSGLKSIGVVESERENGEKKSIERRYFICSVKAETRKFSEAIRCHWHIENKLHWVLDVTFNEDGNRTRNIGAAENLAIMRRIALNAIRQDESKGSLKTKMLRAGWNKEYLVKILGYLLNF
jgi:predicted transposase YbfD/YdcC